ncbi:hypothetical protein TWF281_010035 [Arthrobotrys megalospora]
MEAMSMGTAIARPEATASMLDDIQIRPFQAIARRPTFPAKTAPVQETPAPRKSLFQCFEEARQTFDQKIASPLTRKDPKRSTAIEEFLRGARLDDLGKVCQELSEQAEDKANNTASKLLTTLDQFKGAGDALLQFAPESVSIVWFGISSLITIGSAKVQTRLLICGACDSIANIVADCIRWESMTALMVNEDHSSDMWESDIPNLLFQILEFLWTAKPHFDQSRVKRIGSSLKELFSKELQERVASILEKYEALAKTMQGQFQESMLQGSFKTGQMLDQIRKNLQNYVSIGASLMDSFQKRVLLDELDRQQSRLAHPASYKLHFSTLNDRLTKIIHDRNGKPVASWLFSQEEYCDWKINRADSSTKSSNFLCLRGPRGHGKSVAMMSVHRDITRTVLERKGSNPELPERPPLVCHFFFKKGEQDIERARSALESILYQLLGSEEIRRDINVLAAAINILNPGFGEDLDSSADSRGSGKVSENFHDSPRSLCNAIKMIAAAIPVPVYLMIDALDECLDRRDQNFLENLKALVDGSDTKNDPSKGSGGIYNSKTGNLKLLISARDSVDIASELADSQKSKTPENALPEGIKIVDITSERNSSDLQEYLGQAVGELLTRRIDRVQYEAYYNSQLSRIAKIVHEKANGDFTLARLIIANLQQPSKDTLEKRIKRLPSAIGEIYMASLESLTVDEQEFVVTALRWVVWSVSGLSVLEISDHYKEIYKGPGPSSGDASSDSDERDTETIKHQRPQDKENTEHQAGVEKMGDQDTKKRNQDSISSEGNSEPEYASPYDHPEVKDTIYHIENAGRDFFKFDRNTGVVNVDISIREWVQQDDSNLKLSVKDSRGFNKFRDKHGNTVFQFTLAPSFVRYGDTLSQLFSEKEAHMSIALDILRTLNNEDFQDKYMPWKPNWVNKYKTSLKYEPTKSLRYEMEHWDDHIEALQKWWTEDSLNDSWWAELLTQLSLFTRPETWYRWNLQRTFESYHEWALVEGGISERIKLQEMWKVEYMQRVFQEPIHLACKHGLHLLVDLLVRQAQMSTESSQAEPDSNRTRRLGEVRTVRVQAVVRDFLIDRQPSSIRTHCLQSKHRIALKKLVQDMGSKELLDRLSAEADPKEISPILELITGDYPDHKGISTSIQEATPSQGTPGVAQLVCDSEDIYRRTPLCLAKTKPPVIKRLLKFGANVNGVCSQSRKPISPLKFILQSAADCGSYSYEKQETLLRSAELLILDGANLEAEDGKETTCLHLAATIRDLKFFKLLCVSGEWNVHARDECGRTPLHTLFEGQRPNNPEKVEGVLSIYRMLVKMKKEDDFINTEDDSSKNALAYAVQSGFVEAVELLVSMGADIHDEDWSGANCFHHLSRVDVEDEVSLKIADILLQAGLNYTKPDNRGQTPLHRAAGKGKWQLARYFLSKYDELAAGPQTDGTANPLLTPPGESGDTLFHAAAEGGRYTYRSRDPVGAENAAGFVKELNGILSKYTNTTTLILQSDNTGATPLHTAVRHCCPRIVEVIIAINPDISPINHSLENALDVALGMVISVLRDRMRYGHSVFGDDLQSAFEVVLLLGSYAGSVLSQFPFAFLLGISNHPGLKEEGADLISNTEILKLIDQYEASCKDQHGWHLFEYSLSTGFGFPDDSRYSRKGRTPSPLLGFTKPTRIGWTSSPMELSDDGLEAFLIEPRPNQYQFAISDHPIPPIDAGFYFEVSLSSKPPNFFESSKVFCEIGLKSPGSDYPQITCDIYDGTVSIVDSYEFKWPYAHEYTPEAASNPGASDVQETEPQNPFTNSKSCCFGCGINPVHQSAFFTVDGVIVHMSSRFPLSVYYPFFGFSNYTGKFKMNFGAEKFMFEDANSKDWKVNWAKESTYMSWERERVWASSSFAEARFRRAPRYVYY